jgi:hypothetical protein
VAVPRLRSGPRRLLAIFELTVRVRACPSTALGVTARVGVWTLLCCEEALIGLGAMRDARPDASIQSYVIPSAVEGQAAKLHRKITHGQQSFVIASGAERSPVGDVDCGGPSATLGSTKIARDIELTVKVRACPSTALGVTWRVDVWTLVCCKKARLLG